MSNVEPPPDPLHGKNPIAEPEPLNGFRFRDRPEAFDGEFGGCLWFFITWPWQLWTWLVARMSDHETYHVPPRFGMSAIIGITTSLALLFALFRAVDAHPLIYVFSTLLLFITVLVQMRWGHIARPASIIAGAAWLPLFWVALGLFMEDGPPLWSICCAFPFLLPAGGFLGYLAGTCAGGFFLLMELFEQYWERRNAGRTSETPPANEPRRPPSQLDDLRDPR